MTSFHPDGPPADAFGTSLLDRYPPHGFPPDLGLGLLHQATLRLEPGLSVAEYRQDDDLVYRVTGTYDPTTGADGSSACGTARSGGTRAATAACLRRSTTTSQPNSPPKTTGSESCSSD
jgi:hypothetical protein